MTHYLQHAIDLLRREADECRKFAEKATVVKPPDWQGYKQAYDDRADQYEFGADALRDLDEPGYEDAVVRFLKYVRANPERGDHAQSWADRFLDDYREMFTTGELKRIPPETCPHCGSGPVHLGPTGEIFTWHCGATGWFKDDGTIARGGRSGLCDELERHWGPPA